MLAASVRLPLHTGHHLVSVRGWGLRRMSLAPARGGGLLGASRVTEGLRFLLKLAAFREGGNLPLLPVNVGEQDASDGSGEGADESEGERVHIRVRVRVGRGGRGGT